MVGMTFYAQDREQDVWKEMPQVPQVGNTLHYSLTPDPDDSRAWKVIHVSWVIDDGLWHAEIGLS